MVPRNQNKVVFYTNNYINWDQFNQLYNFYWIEKALKNIDAVAYTIESDLTRVIDHRLKVAKEKR